MRAGEFSGKVAIITGAASGMGLAAVHRFLAAGAGVVAGDLNPAVHRIGATLDPAVAARLRVIEIDVALEADIAALVALAAKDFGRLDIMFNNAGIGGAIGPVTEVDYADWRKTFAILTDGVFLGIKHAAKQMIAQGQGGVIINTASVAGMSGGAGPLAYSAAKAAVISMTQNAAVELARHRIRVNAISPGAIFTPLMHGGREARAQAAIDAAQPWPDRGEPEHIADLALFLSSDRSAFITGQAIVADGGLTAAGTRLRDQFPSTTSTHAGFTYGSTGQPNTLRRLAPSDGIAP